MEIKKGIGVSPGVVIGEAFVLESEDRPIMRRFCPSDQVEEELARFDHALDRARDEIGVLARQVSDTIGEQYGGIFQAHLSMLGDETLLIQVRQLIEEKNFTSEYAVSRIIRKYMKGFRKIQDPYLAERVRDLADIEHRLLRALSGEDQREAFRSRQGPMILIAHDLTTAQTATLDKKRVLAFATDLGGRTSHTAIVARGLNIPAVVGAETITADVATGDTVILDGTHGIVILGPDDATLAKYQEMRDGYLQLEVSLRKLRRLPAITEDGVEASLMGNIEFPQEVELAVENGAHGIGLYRTEFLYLGGGPQPSEEDHFEAYAHAIKLLGDRPLTVRTLDLGADKLLPGSAPVEKNPFLGLRSIRLSLQHISLFKVQLRAILRASALGDVRILLPLVSNISEVRRSRRILESVKDELRKSGQAFREDIQMGIMVEVPSVAVAADFYARECDFFSLGTNDLIQYTLAVDRVNERIANLFTPADPAVLRLVRNVIGAADAAGIPVAMCGEMSGDPLFTVLLLGMGLREFSVTPAIILEIKKIIRSVTVGEAEEVAKTVFELKTPAEITRFLREKTSHIIPEAM